MELSRGMKSDAKFVCDVVEAGWQGLVAAGKGVADATPQLKGLWGIILAGAAVGAVAGTLAKRGRSTTQGVVAGTVVGTALGFAGGLAWASRESTGRAARETIGTINTVRDQHWLEKNPISYA